MGQGAPEVGPIPGAADRPTHIDYPLDALEYGTSHRCVGSYVDYIADAAMLF